MINVTQTNKSHALTDGLNDLVMTFSVVVLNRTEARGIDQAVTVGISIGSTSVYVGSSRFNYSDKTLVSPSRNSASLVKNEGFKIRAVLFFVLFKNFLFMIAN